MYRHLNAKNQIITRQNATFYTSAETNIPSSIKKIATEAFQKKNVIQTIVFPNSLTSIGARAFRGCTCSTGNIFTCPSARNWTLGLFLSAILSKRLSFQLHFQNCPEKFFLKIEN